MKEFSLVVLLVLFFGLGCLAGGIAVLTAHDCCDDHAACTMQCQDCERRLESLERIVFKVGSAPE